MTTARDRHPVLLILLAFIAFISLGLPDTILGVAWPFIRATFGRPLDSLAFLLMGGVSGYLTSSFLSGTILQRLGVGKLLLFSSLFVTIALAGNAIAPAFGWMVALSVIGGLGAGAIDAGLNAYAAKHFSSRVMNWLHAFYGVGATIGPAMMTALLSAKQSWRMGYAILAGAISLLTILFLLTLKWWEDHAASQASDDHPHVTIGEALARPIVWMQAMLFFIYCGIESTASQLTVSLFKESRGMSISVAGSSVAGYWAALTGGRIIFGQLTTRFSHTAILRTGMILSVIAAILVWLNLHPAVSIVGIVLLGFSLAPIYPTLISDTPKRVGERLAPQSVGFQVSAAAIGIALCPGSVSAIAQRIGLESVCVYLVIGTAGLLILNEFVARGRGRDSGFPIIS